MTVTVRDIMQESMLIAQPRKIFQDTKLLAIECTGGVHTHVYYDYDHWYDNQKDHHQDPTWDDPDPGRRVPSTSLPGSQLPPEDLQTHFERNPVSSQRKRSPIMSEF